MNDQEIIDNLDLLLEMDLLEEAKDSEVIESLEEIEGEEP
jgi:hypothetical protein